ncbi:MAG: exodeoxyribonuclease VII small subunit [Chloroflexota bacterium]
MDNTKGSQADQSHKNSEQTESTDLSHLTYEEATEQLEAILVALEAGDLPLEKSLTLYEQGALLAAHCEQTLDQAELRVRQWQPDGEPTPFTNWQDE